MKHRGRHRRQRRGRALRAFLAGTALALTGAATMISASQATDSEDPGALKPVVSSERIAALRWQEQQVPEATLDRLASEMGRTVGVSAVLQDADHSLRAAADCPAEDLKALPVEPAATRAQCWDAADTRSWQPGAVTTSGDADDDGLWGQNRVVLSGWSQNAAAGHGLARVAFVDANDLDRLTYTWVLLTVPVDGGRDFRALDSDVSGMVWYQDKLLVTAADGVYVYDMNRVLRTSVVSTAVGRVPGGWSAHRARFVLPAVGSYRPVDPATDTDARPFGLSLDRSTTPDSLVASERTTADGDGPALLWRSSFATDPARSGLLATDFAGRTDATEAYETKAADVQGVLSYRSDWYVSRASGEQDGRGTLWRQDADTAKATRCGSDDTQHCWSARTPSLSYWEATGEVWSQSGQMLFALPLASIDRSLG
ncbi:hypothetical protein [Streptomyces sp. NBC_01373]|uniref:hypothetical protein n=1 Tax=unclassified Streptomyces TaxID=2593676 RepID=UPI00225BFCAC|nr:hypothetical protein [Streptomyces sp. NBC_01373]MCX4704421.1 hypothetical protein [Streptomyces sp. NBC_01373]